MHTNETTELSGELRKIAAQIKDYQDRRGLSDAALCREFGGLGSTKTFKRILEGDFAEMNTERQFENYTRVLELTRIKPDPDAGVIYDDFRHVRQTLLAVKEALREKGNDHLVILEGATGSGKTETMAIIEREFPNLVIRVEAHGGWKIGNNPLTVMAGDMLRAAKLREYGEADGKDDTKTVSDAMPQSFAARKEKLFDALNVRKRLLLIDEGQEMGPYCLNMLKSIINQTPTVVVLAVIPTIFRRLESRSYEDAIQLTGNRLYERIRIASPQAREIGMFLERRGVKFVDADVAERSIAKLSEKAAHMANWKYINRFARRAKAAKGGVDEETFIEHVKSVERALRGTV